MEIKNFGSANISSKNVTSILNKARGFNQGYDFTLNPYQGCQYQCSYCYAAAFTRNNEMREEVKQDFERRSPSIKARLKTVSFLKQNLHNNAKVSVTITPTLPTFPEDEDNFINQLGIAVRVVLHKFLPSRRTFVGSTRNEALTVKQKYSWWYDNEADSYQQFKAKLIAMLPNIEIIEGKAGFQY